MQCEICGDEIPKSEMPWFYIGHWFCKKHDASKPWLLEFKMKVEQ